MRLVLFLVLLSAAFAFRLKYDADNFPQTDPNRFLIMFHDIAKGKQLVHELGGKVLLDLPIVNGAAISLSPKLVARVANSSFVKLIEPDVPRWPMGQSFADPQVTPYGIPMVQADVLSEGTASSVVCIIDSGFDASHEDLQLGALVKGDASTGWNTDKCGHGTHVAGTIAAVNNAIGVVGVSNNLNLYIFKVFGDDCSWTYSSTLLSAATACTSAGSQVVLSMSLGCSAAIDARCKSSTEETGFNNLWNQGHVSVAAAGNSGNSWNSYPASYSSVISVAAVDSTGDHASFSQTNTQVEIAAPGVTVYSTVPMGSGEGATTTVAGNSYSVQAFDGSPKLTGIGPLFDCGFATSVCNANGGVCLISRGNNSFAEKVQNCQSGRGVAAIIYNNAAGTFSGTLNGADTSIPSVSMSQADGQALLASVGLSTTVSAFASNYENYDGTSMATPHVSGVLAKVWAHNKGWTNNQIRTAMQNSAKLATGQVAKDTKFGFGIVQAQAMLDTLQRGV